MRGDSRASECTRVSSARDLLPRDYETPRDLPTSSLSLFLDLFARRAFLGSFFAPFGYQLYQFYTELDRARRFCRFLFPQFFFFPHRRAPSERTKGPGINPRLIVTHHALRIAIQRGFTNFICTTRLSIFATLLHYVSEIHQFLMR